MDQSDSPQRHQRYQRLSPAEQAQLEKVLQGTRRSVTPEIARHPPQSEASLSPSQERLWFLDQLIPQSTVYHLPLLLRLTGKLDRKALEQALQEVVQRHEALRTCFRLRQGRPMQIIAPHSELVLVKNDLSSYPESQRILHLQTCIEAEMARPFDLEHGPLLRATLLTLHSQEHRLFILLHHIIGDAWSLRILIQEVSALYQAYSTGQVSPFAELPLQLSDYVAWLQETSNAQEQHLTYWNTFLQNAPAVLSLPLDRVRPPVQGYHGSWIVRHLPTSLVESLKALAQKERVTLYMLFLAAYALLLWRYSNETDLVIGTPIAQRNKPGLEQVIGFVANTLALRADLSGNPSFRDLLRRIRTMALEAFAHADTPFEKVVERIQPTRSTSYSPLFQVMFVFQNIGQAPIQLEDVRIEVEGIENRGAQFDLILAIAGDHCRFEYNTDLFDTSTIARMATHFEVLLQSVVATPDQRIAELSFLTAEERDQMLVTWNAAHSHLLSPLPSSQTLNSADLTANLPARCIHYLFERQAALTPTAVALIFENQQLTYHELNQRANQVAHALIARGIGQEDLVGIAMERSLELLVGLLGILKAGAAYLPLDPLYPRERLSFMLKESHVSLLLTQPHVQSQLPDHHIEVVCLDASWESIAAEGKQNPPPRSESSNAVYVIFTSGSTGQPKGIVVQHEALVNHALAMVDAIGLNPQQRFLQFASISFDASAVQIYPTLISGATLVLHRTPTALSTYDLWHLCEAQRVTVLDIPVAYWQQWIEDMAASNIAFQPPLQVFMTGGELPNIEKVRLWARTTRQPAAFISSYGPTEATITAAMFLTPNDEEKLEERLVIPLGRPLANVSIYLLDHWMHPVPIGAIGEVYIGGIGLARGYLDNPALTAASFIPNPFAPEPGTRLYRTGDLARYLPDGTLEFQGRRDHQIKIRGFRIEPGEIEALLNQHWAVQKAVVLAREDTRGGLGLIAAILPKLYDQETIARLQSSDEAAGTLPSQAHEVSLAELQRVLIPVLRRFLKERLPAYMIPAAFVVLNEFPMTQSGKVDLQAIPTPDTQLASTESYVAPRTVVEELLLNIWMDLLGKTQVGVHDSFFDLGGHSLLATQLISQVRRVFKLELPLHRLFEAPTVAEFAEILRQAETQPGQVQAIARRRKQIDSMSADEIRARLLQEKKIKG